MQHKNIHPSYNIQVKQTKGRNAIGINNSVSKTIECDSALDAACQKFPIGLLLPMATHAASASASRCHVPTVITTRVRILPTRPFSANASTVSNSAISISRLYRPDGIDR